MSEQIVEADIVKEEVAPTPWVCSACSRETGPALSIKLKTGDIRNVCADCLWASIPKI